MRALVLILLAMTALTAAEPAAVELLNVQRYVMYQTNGGEYANGQSPARALVMTFKFNHSAGVAVANANVGQVYLVAGGKRTLVQDFGRQPPQTVIKGFSADRYRRLDGEILNQDLGSCTIQQVIVWDPKDVPQVFDIEAVGFGINERKETFVFPGVRL